MKTTAALLAAMAIHSGAAEAAPRCMMRAVRPTGAIESPASMMKAGETFGALTQVRAGRSTLRISYCAHGDYWYPATNLEFVTPCRISSLPEAGDLLGNDEKICVPR
jgi:hypothetical protein